MAEKPKTKPKTRRVAGTKAATKTKAKRPAVKKATAKKAVAKKPVAKKAPVAAKPKAAPKERQPTKRDLLGPKVLQLRSEGLTWKEIGKKLKVDVPSVVLAYEFAVVKPAQKKAFAIEDRAELAQAIANARDNDNLSWFKLQARTGKSQQTLKKLYTEATGDDANQGFEVMKRMIATKVAAKGGSVKSKKTDGTKIAAKAKRSTARGARKKATGSANPSKG